MTQHELEGLISYGVIYNRWIKFEKSFSLHWHSLGFARSLVKLRIATTIISLIDRKIKFLQVCFSKFTKLSIINFFFTDLLFFFRIFFIRVRRSTYLIFLLINMDLFSITAIKTSINHFSSYCVSFSVTLSYFWYYMSPPLPPSYRTSSSYFALPVFVHHLLILVERDKKAPAGHPLAHSYPLFIQPPTDEFVVLRKRRFSRWKLNSWLGCRACFTQKLTVRRARSTGQGVLGFKA